MEMKHISILFSVCGVASLFFLSMLTEPIFVDLSEISKYEGREIITEGIVVDKHETRYRNTILTLTRSLSDRENSTTTVFIWEPIGNIEYGDKIQIHGKVQKYKGDFEIYVSEAKQIEIIEKWSDRLIPLRIIAETPSEYQGINLKISCKIEKIYHTYLVLRDTRENQKIILFCNTDKINTVLKEGDTVYVNAKIEYNPNDFSYFLKPIDDSPIQLMEG